MLFFFIFFYFIEFQPIKTETSINFLCKRGLSPKFLIQLLETLPIELTETHKEVFH